MSLLTRSHKVILWIIVILTLLSVVALTANEYIRGEVQSITNFANVTITGDVPHILTLKIKPKTEFHLLGTIRYPLL